MNETEVMRHGKSILLDNKCLWNEKKCKFPNTVIIYTEIITIQTCNGYQTEI